MSLLFICRSALPEIGEFNVPRSMVGNTDPHAVQLLALANRAERSLALDHKWQALLANYSFPIIASSAGCPLAPSLRGFGILVFL